MLSISSTQLFATTLSEDDGDEVGIDIVLVIDNSGSMRRADPDRLAHEAAVLLLDTLSGYFLTRENPVEFRFGVVFYDAGVVEEATIGLTTIDSPEIREYIKNRMDVSYTQAGRNTDTPAGLHEALNLFELDNIDNRRYIVLLTDGLDNFRFQGDQFLIDPLRNETLDALSALNIPIFVIGFEFDPEQPMLEESLVDMVSRAGDGGEYFFVSNDDEFTITMLEIRAIITQSHLEYIRGGITKREQYFDLPIPDPYVAAVSINIFTFANVEIDVFFNDENMTADDRVSIVQDMRSYIIVHIMSPDKGLWRVRMSGEEGVAYSIIYIYDYRLTAGSDVVNGLEETTNQFYLGEGHLLGWLSTDGGRVSDLSIYDNVNRAFFRILDANGNLIRDVEVELYDDTFRLSLADFENGDYGFEFHIEHEHFSRHSPTPTNFTILSTERPASDTLDDNNYEGDDDLEVKTPLDENYADNSDNASNNEGFDFDLRYLGIVLIVLGIIIPLITKINRKIMIDDSINYVLDSQKTFNLVGRGYPTVESNNVKIITDDANYEGCKFAKIKLSSCILPLYRLGVNIESLHADYMVKLRDRKGKYLPLSSGNNTVSVIDAKTSKDIGFAVVKVDKVKRTVTGGGEREVITPSFGNTKVFLMLLSPTLVVAGVIMLFVL